MISVAEFRTMCADEAMTADSIVDAAILAGEARHVSNDNLSYLTQTIAAAFGIDSETLDLRIVGSAKLGYSISEKKKKDGSLLPRYRAFSADSDIDVVVVCEDLFRCIWDDLCRYAHGKPSMPWDSERLGDYMVYGWLRPDHFPKVRRCDDWWDLFRRLSSETRFLRRDVRGAIFHSIDDVRRYQRRAVIECINKERRFT